MESPFTPKITIAAIIHPGLMAVRRLWLPFLLIQLCGLALVIAYFHSEAVRQACEHLAAIKRAGGYPFAAVTLGFASGCVPEVFKFITGADRSLTKQRLRNTFFNFSLYSVLGVMADAFYRLMAELFGDTPTIATVAKKVLVDQLIYSPIIGTAWIAVAYTLREHRYRPIATIRSLGIAWYLSRAMPVIVPSWAYWFPMTCLMYSLPSSLTFVYSAFASAACATLVIAVAERKVVRPHGIAAPDATIPTTPAEIAG